jgi:hypothetical protein
MQVFGGVSIERQLDVTCTAPDDPNTLRLDFKISRTFTFGRMTIMPTLEIFNATNSNAIVTYTSTNVLTNTYLQPNSILQPRFYGVGVVTWW